MYYVEPTNICKEDQIFASLTTIASAYKKNYLESQGFIM